MWSQNPINSAMQRRDNSQIDPKEQLPLPTAPSLPRGFRGVRSSKRRSESQEKIERTKRVRFGVPETEKHIYPQIPSMPLGGNQGPRSADPKTSEFAFFKKLKEDAGHTFDHDKNQSKKFKTSDCCKENSTICKNMYRDFSSSLPTANVTPHKSICTGLPFDSALKKSDVNVETAGTILGERYCLQKNAKDCGNTIRTGGTFSNLSFEYSQRHGDQYGHGEIFSKKRRRLRQWIAETSLPQIDELSSQGYDTISLLLSRLFPESNTEKSFKSFVRGQVETDCKFKPNNSASSDVHLGRIHWIPTRNLDFGPFSDLSFPSHWFTIPGEVEFSNSSSLTSPRHVNIKNRIQELDCSFGERAAPSLHSKDNFGSYTKEFGFLTHIRELDEFHYPGECVQGIEPQKLLGWDFNKMEAKEKLNRTPKNAELAMYPISAGSCDDEEQLDLDNRLSASELSTPYLLPLHAPNLASGRYSPSARHGSHNFGEHFLEIEDDTVAVLNQCALPMSCLANHIAEYSTTDTACEDSSSMLSPQHQFWLMRKFLNDEYLSHVTEVFSSCLDVDIRQKCLSLHGSSTDCLPNYGALEFPQNEGIFPHIPTKDKYGIISHFHESMEDRLSINDWPPFYFQVMMNREEWPLLIDKAVWDEVENDMHSDDKKVEYF